jgi:hypothetical protein
MRGARCPRHSRQDAGVTFPLHYIRALPHPAQRSAAVRGGCGAGILPAQTNQPRRRYGFPGSSFLCASASWSGVMRDSSSVTFASASSEPLRCACEYQTYAAT